ncbi:hypothetical protein V8F33_008215, partial [Rhypophila sp. PSN 637]
MLNPASGRISPFSTWLPFADSILLGLFILYCLLLDDFKFTNDGKAHSQGQDPTSLRGRSLLSCALSWVYTHVLLPGTRVVFPHFLLFSVQAFAMVLILVHYVVLDRE